MTNDMDNDFTDPRYPPADCDRPGVDPGRFPGRAYDQPPRGVPAQRPDVDPCGPDAKASRAMHPDRAFPCDPRLGPDERTILLSGTDELMEEDVAGPPPRYKSKAEGASRGDQFLAVSVVTLQVPNGYIGTRVRFGFGLSDPDWSAAVEWALYRDEKRITEVVTGVIDDPRAQWIARHTPSGSKLHLRARIVEQFQSATDPTASPTPLRSQLVASGWIELVTVVDSEGCSADC